MGSLALPQAGDERVAPFATRVGVDGLVRHMQIRFVRPDAAQCPRDLLGRPQQVEHVYDQRLQRTVSIQLARRARRPATHLASPLPGQRTVSTVRRALAPHLAAERACGVAHQPGHAAHGYAPAGEAMPASCVLPAATA